MELFKLLGTIAIEGAENAKKQIDSVTKKAESVTTQIENKCNSIGKSFTGIGKKMTLGLTTPLVLIGKKAISATSNFESAMSEVSAISGATGEDFTRLENKAKEMGEKTKFSATESAEALKYMAMAGWETEDMLDGLEGIMNLAAASGEELGATSDIVTDAITAFGLSASDSAHFADILAKASAKSNTNVGMMGETFKYVAPVAGGLGYTAEDTAIAIGLMANSGIKASQAGTALRSIMSRMVKPTEGVESAMEELGLSITDSEGNMKSLYEVMEDLRTGFAKFSEADSAALANMLAGQEAMSGLLAIVNATEEDFDNLTSAIYDCDGSAQNMADTMNDNLSGQFTLLKSQVEGLAIQFVTLMMPLALTTIEWLSKLCTWISNLDDGTKKLILVITGLVTVAGPVFTVIGKITTGIGGLIKIGSTLIGGTGKLITGIGGIVAKITGGFLPALASITPAGLAIIAVISALIAAGVALWQNWETISIRGTETWENLKAFTLSAIEGIKEGISRGMDAISGTFDKAVGATVEFKDRLVGGLTELKDKAAGKLQELKETATQKVSETKDDIVKKSVELKEKASEAFSGITDKAVEGFQNLREKGSTAIEHLSESFTTTFGNMWNTVVEKGAEFADRFTAPIEAGRDKVREIVTNIKDLFQFEWKLPDIKLPHFDLSWDSDGVLGGLASKIGLPGIPKFDVEWYKDGGIMNEPTAFGFNPYSGKVMAGGEAGAEAIAPIEVLQGYIREAVKEENSQVYQTLNHILALLTQYLPQTTSKQLVLDTGALVGELAEPMNEELGKITYMRGRWN